MTTRAQRSRNRLIRLHRTPFWLASDRASVAGIAATSIERTLVDLAAKTSEERLEVAMEDALRRRLTTADRIGLRLADLPVNQPGRACVLGLLTVRGGAPPAESPLEVKVARMLRAWGYPAPIRQKVLDDQGRFIGRVDFVYPDRRLIIEVDGYRHHDGRVVFDEDRARRNALTALGWVVLHATSTMLVEPGRAEFERDVSRSYDRAL
jgi:very-short-patch-repair endonuclease